MFIGLLRVKRHVRESINRLSTQVKEGKGESLESRRSYSLVSVTSWIFNFSLTFAINLSMNLFWNLEAFGRFLHANENRYPSLFVGLGTLVYKCTFK